MARNNSCLKRRNLQLSLLYKLHSIASIIYYLATLWLQILIHWHTMLPYVQSVSVQLTVICHTTRPVTVWSLPSLWHSHHPNVVGGASLQCSQGGGCTTDSCHLQGPFWWGVHLPWLSGVLDSVGHSSPSKSLPHHCQSRWSVFHTRSDTFSCHLGG